MQKKSNHDVLDMVSDTLARQMLCGLLEVQTERARLQLKREQRFSQEITRVLVTAAILGILLWIWI